MIEFFIMFVSVLMIDCIFIQLNDSHNLVEKTGLMEFFFLRALSFTIAYQIIYNNPITYSFVYFAFIFPLIFVTDKYMFKFFHK